MIPYIAFGRAAAAALIMLIVAAPPARAQDADVAGCLDQSRAAQDRIDHCTAALRRYPHLSAEPKSALIFRRALAFIEIGNLTQAVGDLSVAIGVKPGDPVFHLTRGQVLGNLGRLPAALEDANRAVALAPHLPDPYVLRGEINERLGRRALALADFRRALAIDPNNKRAAAGAVRLGV
jgi:tetratricopeptide (TPR) repeat protein